MYPCCSPFLPTYSRIIWLLKEVLEGLGEQQGQGKIVFVFEESIVLNLFHVAVQCREGCIRRKAIDLLWKYPRREVLSDSVMAAAISTWIMELEESRVGQTYIAEAFKLKIEKTKFVLTERVVKLQCSEPVVGSERVLLPEVTLTWC